MRQPFPRIALGVLVAGLACSPALAFDVPDGQSCGGLVCDLGLFGNKTAPKPAAPPATVAPAPPAPAAPIAERPASPPREPRKVAARRKTHVAKAVAAVPAERKALAPLGAPPLPATLAPASASLATPPAEPPPAASSPIAAVLAPPPPVPAVPVTAPVRQDATVLANPYVYTRPLPFMFQSVDPTQGVQ